MLPGHYMADAVTSLALLLALALAVRQDLIEHRMSNALTAGALAVGLLAQSAFNGLDGFLDALAGAGVGLACLLPLHIARGMGAGDVKLMSAAGAYLGPFNALLAAGLTLVIGAVLAVGIVTWRIFESRAAALRSPSAHGIHPHAAAPSGRVSEIGKERFPYAIAIALGAVVTLWLNGRLEALFRGPGLY